MRNESDKKNKKTSVTMTDDDFEAIKQKAQAAGMGVSPYMVNNALHCDEALTPEKKARIQNTINEACKIAEEYAPDKIEMLQKEAGEIWSL